MIKKDPENQSLFLLCWRYLFSQPVTRQLSSAQTSLTSVFGMGTGGPSPQSTPTSWAMYPENRTSMIIFALFEKESLAVFQLVKSSPRLISIGQLNVLPHLHLRPINDIVYVEPYSISGWEILS